MSTGSSGTGIFIFFIGIGDYIFLSDVYNTKGWSIVNIIFSGVLIVIPFNYLLNLDFIGLKETKLQGILNIAQTIFVCIMLTGATLIFENDARTLVLEPLEVMIEIVEKVSNDPMNAKNVDELQSGVKAKLDQMHRTQTQQELGKWY